MYYTPRFSASHSPQGSHSREGTGADLVRTPREAGQPDSLSPRSPHDEGGRRSGRSHGNPNVNGSGGKPHMCWVCGRARPQSGYPGSPCLFFPSSVASSQQEGGRLSQERHRSTTSGGGRPSLFTLRPTRGGGMGKPLRDAAVSVRETPVSSFTLCEVCDGLLLRDDSTRNPFSSAAPRSHPNPNAYHSTEFLANVKAYQALLAMIAAKVMRASQSFASAPQRTPQDSDVEVVEVTSDTCLSQTPPQLQTKVLGLLMKHLEEVIEKDFQRRPLSHGSALYDATGDGMMTQEERNLFLMEMLAVERAQARCQPHQATAGSTNWQGAQHSTSAPLTCPPATAQASAASPAEVLSSPPSLSTASPYPAFHDNRRMQAMRRELSSSPPVAPRASQAESPFSKGDVQNSQQQPESASPSGRTAFERMLLETMWRVASPDGEDGQSTLDVDRSPSGRRGRRHGNDHGVGPPRSVNAEGAMEEGESNVLLHYLSHRLRSTQQGNPHKREDTLPRSRSRTGPEEDRGDKEPRDANPRGSVPANSTLTALPEQANGTLAGEHLPHNGLQQLSCVPEDALDREVARRRQAEQALLEAHQKIASLEGVTNDMSERLLTSQLNFSTAFHLNYLNDYYSNVMTFFQLFCLRKSMLFAEELSAAVREFHRSQRQLEGERRRATSLSRTSTTGPVLPRSQVNPLDFSSVSALTENPTSRNRSGAELARAEASRPLYETPGTSILVESELYEEERRAAEDRETAASCPKSLTRPTKIHLL